MCSLYLKGLVQFALYTWYNIHINKQKLFIKTIISYTIHQYHPSSWQKINRSSILSTWSSIFADSFNPSPSNQIQFPHFISRFDSTSHQKTSTSKRFHCCWSYSTGTTRFEINKTISTINLKVSKIQSIFLVFLCSYIFSMLFCIILLNTCRLSYFYLYILFLWTIFSCWEEDRLRPICTSFLGRDIQ